jgi:hypothetical protein
MAEVNPCFASGMLLDCFSIEVDTEASTAEP